MPKLYEFRGYWIYFWLNENNELVHIHATKGRPTENGTKIWILKDGVKLEHNKSKIPINDLTKILSFIQANAEEIVNQWESYLGYIKYHK